jgi:tRNA-2-methylthio-N6-dimethylallyladenosine synthase
MQRLVDVIQRRASERAQRFVGRTMEVLVEGRARHDADRPRGRIGHNKVVNFAGIGEPGQIVPVGITGATSQTLQGEIPRIP